LVAQAIKKIKYERPIEFVFKESSGDKDLESPLWKMSGIGVFTKDFREDLLSEKVDLVVHSWKDLDLEEDPETEIFSALARADQRDILLFKKSSLNSNKPDLKFLTSSPRREYNLAFYFKNCLPFSLQSKQFIFEPVRGSIHKRIEKWLIGEADGIILAKAAIDRFLWDEYPQSQDDELLAERKYIREVLSTCLFQCIPLSINPNAAAQGGIAIEIKKNRLDLHRLLSNIKIDHVEESILYERGELKKYGGGCHQKIGIAALKRHYGTVIFEKGMTDSGVVLQRRELIREHEPKAENKSCLWPHKGEALKFIRIAQKGFPKPPEGNLFISRISAWQDEWKQEHLTGILWAAGAKTMSELAKKNLWVSGSLDGLGESEAFQLEKILPGQSFTKLTHEDSDQVDSRFKRIYTYKLELEKDIPDIKNRTHFFWMSGSQFEMVTAKFPEILKANHACGPGLTSTYIEIKTGVKPDIFLSHEDWLEYHS
jgi:hydroxymethylbilane synthase